MNIENLTLLFPQIIIAALGILTPLLQPKNLLFGVRLSKILSEKKTVATVKKKYLISSSLLFFLWILMTNLLKLPNSTIIAGEIVLLFGFYGFYNRKVKNWKELQYKNDPQMKPKNPTLLFDTDFRNQKLYFGGIWYALPIALIVVQLVVNFINRKIVINDNSIFSSVALLCSTNILLTVLIFFQNSIIKNVKQQISATNPEISKEQNITFRKRWSLFLFMLFNFIIAMNLIFNLQLLKILTNFTFMTQQIYMSGIIIFVIATVLMALLIGQSGSRLKIDKKKSDSKYDDVDDDLYWKAGIFYYNPEDPSLWIEKRMGIGWTINFGNKKSWIFILLLAISISYSLFKTN